VILQHRQQLAAAARVAEPHKGQVLVVLAEAGQAGAWMLRRWSGVSGGMDRSFSIESASSAHGGRRSCCFQLKVCNVLWAGMHVLGPYIGSRSVAVGNSVESSPPLSFMESRVAIVE
jgi:hypothetical protein